MPPRVVQRSVRPRRANPAARPHEVRINLGLALRVLGLLCDIGITAKEEFNVGIRVYVLNIHCQVRGLEM